MVTVWLLVLAAFAGGVVIGHALRARTVPETGAAEMELPSSGWDVLAHELERGRRFERPFVLLRMVRPAPDWAKSATDDLLRDVVATVRAIDFVWVSDEGIDVLLPEVGREEGEACIVRLREQLPAWSNDIRLVSFPEDGVTRGALLGALDGRRTELPGADELPVRSRLRSAARWAS